MMAKFPPIAYLRIALILILPIVFFSCSTPKNIPYFKNVPDSGVIKNVPLAAFKQPLIQPDDILSITFNTIDPEITAMLNIAPSQSSAASGSGTTAAPIVTGYLVSKDGMVEIPLLGKIKVSGLTTYEAAELIRSKATESIKSPTVQVRFLNYKITILGEVNKPGIYTVPNEKVTLLDVIGLAGDLTIYGKRDNILVIRDTLGEKKLMRLNISSSDIFKSPGFFLKQNDVIYVEPNKSKIAANNVPQIQLLTILVSLLSVAAILFTKIN